MRFRFFGWMAVAVLVGSGLMLAGCGGGGAEKPKKAKKSAEAPAPPPPPPSAPSATTPPPPAVPAATPTEVVETVVVGTKEEVSMTLQALTELAGIDQADAIKLLGEVSNKRAAAAAAAPAPSVKVPTAELDGLIGGLESMAGELGQAEALKGKFEQLRANPQLVAYVYEHYNMAVALHAAKTNDEKAKRATIQEIMTFVAKQKPPAKEEGSEKKSE